MQVLVKKYAELFFGLKLNGTFSAGAIIFRTQTKITPHYRNVVNRIFH